MKYTVLSNNELRKTIGGSLVGRVLGWCVGYAHDVNEYTMHPVGSNWSAKLAKKHHK